MMACQAASIEVDPMDAEEVLLWTIMRTFEAQAAAQYHAHAPELAPLKEGVGPTLCHLAGTDLQLEESVLGPSMKELVGSAGEAQDEEAVLVAQGLVLERVRQVVYGTIARVTTISEHSRSTARALERVSAETAARVHALFAAACVRIGRPPFSLFAEASDDVLHKLDAVGEGVDEVFGERFGLRFADVVGDFIADLVPVCVELGMDRRKVMSHLAGALMGI
jgi:hypothetical protein